MGEKSVSSRNDGRDVEQLLTEAKRRLELREPIGAAVHEPPGGGEIARNQCLLDGSLAILEKARDDARGDSRVVRPVGLVDELRREPESLAVALVVGAPGK